MTNLVQGSKRGLSTKCGSPWPGAVMASRVLVIGRADTRSSKSFRGQKTTSERRLPPALLQSVADTLFNPPQNADMSSLLASRCISCVYQSQETTSACFLSFFLPTPASHVPGPFHHIPRPLFATISFLAPYTPDWSRGISWNRDSRYPKWPCWCGPCKGRRRGGRFAGRCQEACGHS